ncbi:MAG: glucosyl-3-phosphoglycerate synthase [Chitinivibrionales bacterium]|nr:glucosyl-3-phosphoglycerate synthase [Chitinivibrionales bacterium]MBD3394518.1 glucosyl-3-phosphoglycerate synthase [Chitinivibrionales bacterium]
MYIPVPRGAAMIRQFTHTDFIPLQSVAKEKRRQNLTVSLVVPALNEAATVGRIVSATRKALVDQVGLLDEIIVMDGLSADRTREEAARAGATVYGFDEVAGDRAVPAGKGASLWKSLLVSTGDIVVFIDADITNFHPRFVYGLVAPLIHDPALRFVKAYYERPLEIDGTVLDRHGGRVTEILVRPVLSAFWPDLAEIIQPLAGEYAFRRETVEALPFFSGYGVEIGLVLDIYRACGLDAFAQVDMGMRRHRNRSLRELGKMSFGIVKALFTKLEEHGKISVCGSMHTAMISPDAGAGREQTVIAETELEPIARARGGTT